jgi:hypothetical protein
MEIILYVDDVAQFEGVRWKYAIIIFTVGKYAIDISLAGGCHHSH